MTIRERDIIVYGAIILACIASIFWIIPSYTPPYPGYGVPASLMPNVAIGIILVFSMLGLVRNVLAYRREKAKEPSEDQKIKDDDKVHLWHLAKFMIPCALLMPAMRWIGFIPAGLVFMLLIQYLCGQRKPIPAAFVAICTVGFMYAVMRYALSVPMP